MLRGRYRDGIDHLAEAIALTGEPSAFQSRLRNEMLLSEALVMRGNPVRAAAELDSALRVAREGYLEPGLLALLGRALIRAGRVTDARQVLIRLDSASKPGNPTDQSAHALLTGELALARNAAGEAYEAIRRDNDPTFVHWRAGLLGRALAGRGILDSALTVTAEFSARPLFGFEVQGDWVLAPLQVAELAEKLGDRATAIAALQAFLERWRDADPDLPALQQAKRNLTRLQREPSR
jgi:tetratricopeptide (TPR) repeat protein